MKDTNEIDKILDTAKVASREENKPLPEAPASANCRVKTPNGYQWQFTMRATSVSQLLGQIEDMEQYFQTYGWETPDFFKEKAPKTPPRSYGDCPECGEGEIRELTVQKEGKNHGRRFKGCSNRDCKFFEWIS